VRSPDGDVVVTVDRLSAVIGQVDQCGEHRKLADKFQRDAWRDKVRTRRAEGSSQDPGRA
jgi:hypothetical protein